MRKKHLSTTYSKLVMSALLIGLGFQGLFPDFYLNESSVITIRKLILLTLLIGCVTVILTFRKRNGFSNENARWIISTCMWLTICLWASIADSDGIASFKLFFPPVISVLLFLGGSLSLIYEDAKSHINNGLSRKQCVNIKSLFINSIVICVGMYLSVNYPIDGLYDVNLLSAIVSCIGLVVFWWDLSNFISNKYKYNFNLFEVVKIKSVWFTIMSGVFLIFTS